MELDRDQPPEYLYHNPDELKLPSVPQHDVRHASDPSKITLPNLQTVLATMPRRERTSGGQHSSTDSQIDLTYEQSPRHSISSNTRTLPMPASSPMVAGTTYGNLESAIVSPSSTASVMSVDDHRPRRSTSVVSLEDPDVRMAAEALSGLGNPDFARSPKTRSSQHNSTSTHLANGAQEPLLNLLVDAHPWLGGTINTSLSAYTMTKSYSPGFVRYSANLLERNIGSPMVNTVSTVSKRTGVESGIRRYLGSRRPSDIEHADSPDQAIKRRRMVLEGKETMVHGYDDAGDREMIDAAPERDGREYLPEYRSSKPPSYREEVSPASTERQQAISRPPHDRSWSTQLMIHTSGLGVALSESSLRSLTYCVRLLAKATEHVETVTNALKMLLKEYDEAQESRQQRRAQRAKEHEAGIRSEADVEHEDSARLLAERMKQLSDDIWGTMKTVVTRVSTYAGGALPDNARRVVKSQLMSIPQRWQVASKVVAQEEESNSQANGKPNGQDNAQLESAGTAEDVRKGAHRMVAFAGEGLDMMAQVNGVVKITLESAEDWLRTMGRSNHTRDEEMTDVVGSSANAQS